MIKIEFPAERDASFPNIDMYHKDMTKTFWGVKVSPIKPVTVSFRNQPQKILYISQATIGELCLEEVLRDGHHRSLLSVKSGDNPEVLICSLRMKRGETIMVNLNFAGPSDVVFSVQGPYDIHLAGYVFDVVTPQTCANEGGPVASTSLLASPSKSQLSSLGEGGTCKLSTESPPNPDLFSHIPLLNIPNLSHLRVVDVVDGLNKIKMEGSINILLQGLTVAQIKALRGSMVDKLQETNFVTRKLDYRVVNEGEASIIGHTEKKGFSGNEVEERVEQVSAQGTDQVVCYNEDAGVSGNDVEAEVEHVTTHAIDTIERSGVNGNEVESFANEGGTVASTSLLACLSKRQLSSLDGGDTCKRSTESALTLDLFSHLPLLNVPNLSHLRDVDVLGGSNMNIIRKEGSINIVLQGLTVAQIEALRDIMAGKLQETTSMRRKLDYHVVNEVEARVIDYTAESGFNGNEVEERVELVATQGTAQIISDAVDTRVSRDEVEAEMEHIATHETTYVSDTDEESGVNGNVVERSTGQGSPDHNMLRSRKSKRLRDEEKDHIRSTIQDSVQDPLHDSKGIKRLKKKLKKQKHAEDDDTRAAKDGLQLPTYFEDNSMRCTQYGLPEDSEVDTEDAIKSRKKRKKDATGEARSKKKHDPLQSPLLDSKEAKRLKKKLKKQKLAEDDDTRAAMDDLQTPASDTEETCH